MPLFDLEVLKQGVATGSIALRVRKERQDQLFEILGDCFEDYVRQVCAQLRPADYKGPWAIHFGSPCADVYGIMRDITGEHSDEEYAWYIKFGQAPGQPDCCIMSFHPTSEMTLADGSKLRTTVDGFEDSNDD